MKLEQSDIDEFEKTIRGYASRQEMISNRIYEVLSEVIPKCFKRELDWWDYYGDSGGGRHADGGSLSENWGEHISLYIVIKNGFLNKHSELLSGFPKRYLTMNNEDIVEEINLILEQEDKEEEQTREKERLAKEAKNKKKQDVIATLTKEQKEALGLK